MFCDVCFYDDDLILNFFWYCMHVQMLQGLSLDFVDAINYYMLCIASFRIEAGDCVFLFCQ